MVPIARCAWSAQNAEESLGSATMEGCAKSDRRLRSNLPYLGKSSRRETILQYSSATFRNSEGLSSVVASFASVACGTWIRALSFVRKALIASRTRLEW